MVHVESRSWVMATLHVESSHDPIIHSSSIHELFLPTHSFFQKTYI